MKCIYKAFAILFGFFIFVGCEKNERLPIVDKTDGEFKRTVFLYMIADNILKPYGNSNIQTILNASKDIDLFNNNIVIYYDAVNSSPCLLEITKKTNNIISIDTLNIYEERNSCSVAIMSEMLDRVIDGYPSQKYGLVLWGHGSSWLPQNKSKSIASFSSGVEHIRQPSLISFETKSYGGDDGEWLDIADLKEAIPNHLFDYILIDACFMAGVEVAYELKDKAEFIIASSAEILANGFPYSEVTKYLVMENPDYKEICDLFYEHYNNKTDGRNYERTATVSLIDTHGLDELAQVTKNIFTEYKEDMSNLSLINLQVFDRYNPNVIYDLGNYIKSFVSDEEYSLYKNYLDKVIIHDKATEWYLQGEGGRKINSHSGFTIYPYYNLNLSINENYKQTDWYKAVYE